MVANHKNNSRQGKSAIKGNSTYPLFLPLTYIVKK